MTGILDDKYEVLEQIGCGGAGKVYLARDMHLERLVVIKESREELLLTEIELLKELIHPGLPLIYDCFKREIPLQELFRKELFRKGLSRKELSLLWNILKGCLCGDIWISMAEWRKDRHLNGLWSFAGY